MSGFTGINSKKSFFKVVMNLCQKNIWIDQQSEYLPYYYGNQYLWSAFCISVSILFIYFIVYLFKIHVIRPVLNRIDILVETTVTDIQG